ncbi:MAG: hypothetical protein F2813_04985 [Actinobacteria bacterium]|uniref:Unannotated protein n=1 Tax=freshwater metagenome TaxID=449393 RepID=A0A6J5ZQX9_9ZZZZ|nr:hypothetical protein [Actinomycetota bacterium]
MTKNSAKNNSKGNARTNSTVAPVFLASLALFGSVAGFLGVQVASGQDPMLGAKTANVQPKQVTVRKLVVTRKVVTIVRDPAAAGTATGSGTSYASSSAGSGSSYSAPTQSYSAPAQSAPAPAPVQTATS